MWMVNNYNGLDVWELRENSWVSKWMFGKLVLNKGEQNDKTVYVLNMEIY